MFKVTVKTVDFVIGAIQLFGMALGVGFFVHLCFTLMK